MKVTHIYYSYFIRFPYCNVINSVQAFTINYLLILSYIYVLNL